MWDEQDAHVAQRAAGAQDAVQCMRRESAACTAASPHRQRLQRPSQGQGRPAHRPSHLAARSLDGCRGSCAANACRQRPCPECWSSADCQPPISSAGSLISWADVNPSARISAPCKDPGTPGKCLQRPHDRLDGPTSDARRSSTPGCASCLAFTLPGPLLS